MNFTVTYPCMLLACSALFASVDCQARTVSICIPDLDVAPVVFPTHDGQAQWLVRKAIESQGDVAQFVPVPWRRCIDGAKRGTYDAALPPTANPQFLQDLAFPMRGEAVDVDRSIVTLTEAVVRRLGDRVNWDGHEFTGLTTPVLLIVGTAADRNKLDQMGIPYDPGAYTFEQILAKLVARRGDIAISPELDMVKLLKQDEFRGKLEILPTPFMITNNYLAFNRAYYQGSTMYVEAIWNEIKRLRASKEWQIMAPKLVQ